jgi:hypothetical protein
MEQLAEIGEAVTSGLAYIGSLATLAWHAAYFTFIFLDRLLFNHSRRR